LVPSSFVLLVSLSYGHFACWSFVPLSFGL
jgi:hypothetical protein